MKSKHCVALLSKTKCFKFNKELCIDSCRKEPKLIEASYFYELKEEKGHSMDWKEVEVTGQPGKQKQSLSFAAERLEELVGEGSKNQGFYFRIMPWTNYRGNFTSPGH